MNSLIKKYTNGYEAHWIDRHPKRFIFRDVDFYLTALPDEKIVILKDGVIVMYLPELPDLNKLEKELALEEK